MGLGNGRLWWVVVGRLGERYPNRERWFSVGFLLAFCGFGPAWTTTATSVSE